MKSLCIHKKSECGVAYLVDESYALFFWTVTTDVYLRIFNEFVSQLTDDVLTTGYYQKDAATCHTSNASMREIENFLNPKLSQKTFGHPDLPIWCLPISFFGAYWRGKCKKYTPHNRTIQRRYIPRDQVVNVNTLGKVFQNLEKRIQMCLYVKGDEFQNRL